MNSPKITLHDGNKIPQLGLGVWQASNEEVIGAVETALDVGYRHIDTAAVYRNEEGVGKAIKNSSIPRKDIFITTKLWNERQDDVEKAFYESLEKLQLDYVDLYLIHWPAPPLNQYVNAWKGLIKLKEQKLVKSIGVSNFLEHHLQKIINETDIIPVINQIECHPVYQRTKLREFNKKYNIITESWSPLARGQNNIFENETITNLSKKYNKTAAQIIIRWHLDIGNVVIPKSVNRNRIKENFDVFDFSLTKEEMNSILALDAQKPIDDRMDPNTFITL